MALYLFYVMDNVQDRLLELAKMGNPVFARSLHPGIDNVLGIRILDIRKLAKQLAAEVNWKENIAHLNHYYMEERILHGMIIGYVKNMTLEDRLSEIEKFLPLINSWSVCDTFCSTLKLADQYQSEVWNFILPHFHSDKEYTVRFAIVMALSYYVNSEYVDKVLSCLNDIHHDAYYVKMAIAWAVSVCYVKYPVETEIFFKNNLLDDFTQNKALQKIRESFRVSSSEKERLKIYCR